MEEAIILNDDQQIAAKKLDAFLRDPNSAGRHFTLTGFPGTGKTFSLQHVLKDFTDATSIIGGAFSHAAKNVLQESLQKIDCYTIAQLLGMKMQIDESNGGQMICVPDRWAQKRIRTARVVVLDEVSMIDDSTYDLIMTEAQNRGIKIIAVGDPDQLPAVGQEHDSKFFNRIDAALTIPVRFTGPIGDVAAIYRKEISNIRDDRKFNKWALNEYTERKDNYDNANQTGYKFLNILDDMIENAAYDIKNNLDNKNHTRVLAFTNEAVDYVNKEIRYHIYGKKPRQFMKDEVLIATGGYAYEDKPVLFNGQVVQINNSQVAVGPYGVPCLLVNFNGTSTNGAPVYVVQRGKEAQKVYKRIEEKLVENAKRDRRQWKHHRAFKDSFATFNYGYACSLYKCQGMTLENVYVCEGEVMDIKPITWQQKFQALYVAMTRAKKNLYIYNKDF